MDKEQLKKQILARMKPRPIPMKPTKAKALLARYGQKYQPGGEGQATDTESAET